MSESRIRTTSKAPWYELPEDDPELARRVFSDLLDIKTTWTDRYAKWDRNERLVGASLGKKTRIENPRQHLGEWDGYVLNYSIVRALRDAVRARLATRRTKVRAQTAGARYLVRERARLLTKQLKGIFGRSNIYLKNHQIFNDVCDYGIGYAKPYEVSGQIRIDRVHPRSVVMDEPDSGVPSEWYHFMDVPKRQLSAQYPELEAEIWRSTIMDLERNTSARDELDTDWVTVAEGWYCPQDAEGRHIIVVSEMALVDDDWKSISPGVVPNRFFEPAEGFVGDSLPDIVGSIQEHITYLLGRIQDQMDIGGTLKLLVDAGSDVDVEVLSNELIQVIKHNGTRGVPIQLVPIPAIDPVYFQELDRAKGEAYSLVGMSELWASSEKPAGLNSGKAISEMDDITSARFLDIAQCLDYWYVELGRACKALASSIPGFQISVNGVSIPWSEIELSEDEYDLSIAPVSMLPDTAPGTIQKILDDAQTDANIAADQLVLLDSLDHEAYVRELIAPKLAAEKYLDEIFYDHKNKGLAPQLDLVYLESKRVLRWNQAYLKEDQKAMDMLDRLGAQILSKQEQLSAPAPGSEQQPPAMQSTPAPPPTGELPPMGAQPDPLGGPMGGPSEAAPGLM